MKMPRLQYQNMLLMSPISSKKMNTGVNNIYFKKRKHQMFEDEKSTTPPSNHTSSVDMSKRRKKKRASSDITHSYVCKNMSSQEQECKDILINLDMLKIQQRKNIGFKRDIVCKIVSQWIEEEAKKEEVGEDDHQCNELKVTKRICKWLHCIIQKINTEIKTNTTTVNDKNNKEECSDDFKYNLRREIWFNKEQTESMYWAYSILEKEGKLDEKHKEKLHVVNVYLIDHIISNFCTVEYTPKNR